MKWFIGSSSKIFGMANLVSGKTQLPVDIWSQHKGIEESHRGTPKLKLSKQGAEMSIAIKEHPVIKAKSRKIKKSDIKDFNEGIEYVSRKYDLFLKHYYDVDDKFDDEALFNALRERGEYR